MKSRGKDTQLMPEVYSEGLTEYLCEQGPACGEGLDLFWGLISFSGHVQVQI